MFGAQAHCCGVIEIKNEPSDVKTVKITGVEKVSKKDKKTEK